MPNLTELTATEIAKNLAARQISSEEVTRAHLDRISELDPKLHAFTTVLHDEAIAAARRSDEERRRGHERGPLHGMPISVKESLDFVGYASTLGVPSRRSAIAKDDAGIVEMARRAGAVILGRTNVSQLLLFHESDNPLFGRVANPWSLDHTPGGSSGGEASAIAAGMSPLGIGTDIGGSIRVPAHFAGIAGLKPTLDRWTNKGSNGALLGQEGTRSQLGPMARTARDVALFFRALDPVAMTALDPRVPPLPIGDADKVDVSKLKVGVWYGDGIVELATSVRRALDEAGDALRSRVASVKTVEIPWAEDVAFTYLASMSADGGRITDELLEGCETIHPTLASLRKVASLGKNTRRAIATALGLMGEKKAKRAILAVGEKPVTELWRLTSEMRSMRTRLLQLLHDEDVDILLAPVHATAALPHGASKDFVLAGSASILFNVTQLPAGVVPVTRARQGEAKRDPAKGRLERMARAVDERSTGLPIGIQVVGRPWEEDNVLAAMIALEDALPNAPKTPVFAPPLG